MLINNIDITEYNATLLDRRISTDNVITNTQWGIQSNHGELINEFKDFRQIYLQFLIINPNEQIAYNNIYKVLNKRSSVFKSMTNSLAYKIESIGEETKLQLNLKASENSYYIIKNNYSLFKDTNHNQSYGSYLVGKYIFDEVNKQNEHNMQLQAH